MLLGGGRRGNPSPSVWLWVEPLSCVYVLMALGSRRLGQAVVLFWQAVFEGRADADPSAFANEVLLPTFFLPLIAAYFGKVVGGEWSRLDEE